MDRRLINSFAINLKSAFRNLKSAILIGAMLFALCASAEAQQPKKIPRIGYLSGGGARIDVFRQGLRELGYVEGENIIIEWRSAEEKLIAFPHSRPSLCVSR